MKKTGFIEIRIIGTKGNLDLGVEAGELNPSALYSLMPTDYQSKYDEDYLKALRVKARKNWLSSVELDSWLRELRGSYDA